MADNEVAGNAVAYDAVVINNEVADNAVIGDVVLANNDAGSNEVAGDAVADDGPADSVKAENDAGDNLVADNGPADSVTAANVDNEAGDQPSPQKASQQPQNLPSTDQLEETAEQTPAKKRPNELDGMCIY